MKYWNELNERYAAGKDEGFAEGLIEGRAQAEEENRLLGERLRADGRASEAFKVLSDPEFRAHELEKYQIAVSSSAESPDSVITPPTLTSDDSTSTSQR